LSRLRGEPRCVSKRQADAEDAAVVLRGRQVGDLFNLSSFRRLHASPHFPCGNRQRRRALASRAPMNPAPRPPRAHRASAPRAAAERSWSSTSAATPRLKTRPRSPSIRRTRATDHRPTTTGTTTTAAASTRRSTAAAAGRDAGRAGFIRGHHAIHRRPGGPGTGITRSVGIRQWAFSPTALRAYFTCFGYVGKNVALWLSRSSDGGRSWTGRRARSSPHARQRIPGRGEARGSNGQFPDHESITVANDGTIYVPWAHFTGFSAQLGRFSSRSRTTRHQFRSSREGLERLGGVGDQDARVVAIPRPATPI